MFNEKTKSGKERCNMSLAMAREPPDLFLKHEKQKLLDH